MTSVEDRVKYDDFEMQDELDKENSLSNIFYKPKKIPTSMRLDNDILVFLKKEAIEKKIAYQTLINSLLREHMSSELLKWAGKV